MKTSIKLISFLLLSAIAYAKVTPYTLVTIKYMMGGKTYSYQEKIGDSNLSKEAEDSDALSIFKSADRKYRDDYLEVLFKVEVRVNRDISNLVISDEIDKQLSYQEGSLLLNGKSPNRSDIVKNILNITIGDAKEGELYRLSYVGRVKVN